MIPAFDPNADTCQRCDKNLVVYRMAFVNKAGEMHCYVDLCAKCSRAAVRGAGLDPDGLIHRKDKPAHDTTTAAR